MRRDDESVGDLEACFDRLGQPRLEIGLDDEPIDDGVDGMSGPLRQFRSILDFVNLAVDADANEALALYPREHFLVLAALTAHQRREDHQSRLLRQRENVVDNLRDGAAMQRLLAAGTERLAHAGKQQPQVVVDFRRCRHG